MNASEAKTPGQRLRHARVVLGKTLENFGAPMDRSRGAISRWETDQIGLTALEAGAVEHFWGISAAWILRGEEPVWISKALVPADDADLHYRPLIAGAASCGPGGEIADPGPMALRTPFRKEFLQELLQESGGGAIEDLYVVACSGESMRPTVHPGDLALINTAVELRIQPKRNVLYLVRSDPASAEGRIKRVRIDADGQLWFMSDAPGFPPIAVDLDGLPLQSLILGRVCWIARSVVKDEQNW